MFKTKLFQKPMLSYLHGLSEVGFKKAGFQWDVRQRGELKLGLIRKKLNKNKKMRRLVFIPGFGDTPLSWIGVFIPMLPFLKKHYDEIIWIDFPGFAGFLSKEKAFHSLERLKESLFDTLDTLEPDTLMGHSLGGWLAASYAAQNDKVKKLILVCPGGVALGEENQAYWKALFQSAQEKGFSSFRKHVFHKEPFWFSFLQDGFIDFFSKEEIVQFMESISEKDFLHQEIHKIKSAVIFIWGEKDTLIPFEWVEDWTQKLKVPSRVIRLYGVGHSPQIEAPVQIVYLLLKILRNKKLKSHLMQLGKLQKGFQVEMNN